MTTQVQEPVTREQLKIMALRERVAQLTAEYEDKVADLRVELTIVSQERDELKGAQGGSGDEVLHDEGYPHNVGNDS